MRSLLRKKIFEGDSMDINFELANLKSEQRKKILLLFLCEEKCYNQKNFLDAEEFYAIH